MIPRALGKHIPGGHVAHAVRGAEAEPQLVAGALQRRIGRAQAAVQPHDALGLIQGAIVGLGRDAPVLHVGRPDPGHEGELAVGQVERRVLDTEILAAVEPGCVAADALRLRWTGGGKTRAVAAQGRAVGPILPARGLGVCVHLPVEHRLVGERGDFGLADGPVIDAQVIQLPGEVTGAARVVEAHGQRADPAHIGRGRGALGAEHAVNIDALRAERPRSANGVDDMMPGIVVVADAAADVFRAVVVEPGLAAHLSALQIDAATVLFVFCHQHAGRGRCLEPKRHGILGLRRDLVRTHIAAAVQAKGVAEPTQGRGARAGAGLLVFRDAAGAVRRDRILERQPKRSLLRQLGPIHDQRAGRLCQAVDAGGRRACHGDVAADGLLLLRLQHKAARRDAALQPGREAGAEQALGVAVHQLVLHGRLVAQRIPRLDVAVGG